VLVVSVGGYVIVTWFDGTIIRLPLSLGSGSGSGVSNWLLVGTDSRAGTGNEYGGSTAVAGQRSDTTILAHLAKDGTTTTVSIPRDTYVQIPLTPTPKACDTRPARTSSTTLWTPVARRCWSPPCAS